MSVIAAMVTVATFAGAAAVEEVCVLQLDGSRIGLMRVRESVKAGVTGLSFAIIGDGQMADVSALGYRDASARTPVDTDTVFSAASLAKPVFAYLVMALAEDGVLELDRPLVEYLPIPLHDDPAYEDLADDLRYERITPRMALSHTTGFPNWRWFEDDGRLRIRVDPGARFGYSGEGFALLQKAVEQTTGTGLQQLAQERVFGPLGMTRTSYVWRDEFSENYARPHDEFGRVRNHPKMKRAGAAGSLLTTAGDYSRFLVRFLQAESRGVEAVGEMLRPHVAITSRRIAGPGAWQGIEGDRGVDLAWGLGWGRFDCDVGRAFFHYGKDPGQAYAVAFVERGVGITLLSNSQNLEGVAREIVKTAIGDTYSPFDWIGYVPFDPASRREPPPEPVAVGVPVATLRRYVGVYFVGTEFNGAEVRVRLVDGELRVAIGDADESPLLPESETRFFITHEHYRLVFTPDASGARASLVFDSHGERVQTTRIE